MADKFVFSNFAVTTLSESIGPDDTTIQINVDDVYRFPVLVGGAKFPIVLADSDDILEIMYVVTLDLGGVALVERGREGTQAQSWLSGTEIQHTWTAASIIGAAGLRPRGTWSSILSYEPGDIVEHTDISWIAVLENVGSAPSDANPDWQVSYRPPSGASASMNWAGRWNSSTTYAAGRVVEWNGDLWQSAVSNLNSAPVDGNANWVGLAQWFGSTKHETVLIFAGVNNYTTTIPATSGPTVLYDGLTFLGKFNLSNTAAGCTATITGLPAIPLRAVSGADIGVGSIIPGELYEFTYLAGTAEFVARQAPGTSKRLTALEASIATQALPVGTIIDYASTVEPAGWLRCNGQLVSRTTYAALFAVVGTAYGAGNGTTTFAVPDLRGRVVAGSDTMGAAAAGRLAGFALGSTGGQANISLGIANMPAHSHLITDPGHTHGVTDPGHAHTYNDTAPTFLSQYGAGGIGGANNSSVSGLVTGTQVTGISVQVAGTGITTTQSVGSGTAFSILQPTIALTKLIRAV